MLPSKRTHTRTIHEWAIETPCDAKAYEISRVFIETEMLEMGIDMSYDDAYRVRVSDEEVVFYVEVESNA